MAVPEQIDQLEINQLSRICVFIVSHECTRLLVGFFKAIARLITVLNDESIDATLASILFGDDLLLSSLHFPADLLKMRLKEDSNVVHGLRILDNACGARLLNTLMIFIVERVSFRYRSHRH